MTGADLDQEGSTEAVRGQHQKESQGGGEKAAGTANKSGIWAAFADADGDVVRLAVFKNPRAFSTT